MSETTNRFVEIARARATEADAKRITSVQSPAVAEILGRHLAATMSASDADVIVVWDLVESAILGHVVARELSADVVYAYSDQGILELGEGLHSTSKVALLSYDWTEEAGLGPLVRLVSNKGAKITVIGSVTAARDSGPVPNIAVISLEKGVDVALTEEKTASPGGNNS